MSIETQKHRVFTVMIYLFGFLLLWEWLKPLQVVTDTGSLTYFIVFIALSLVLSYVRVHYFITAPVKILFILYSLHGLYYTGSFFSLAWLRRFSHDLWVNIGLTLGRDWPGLSFEYRSLLFFILLWLMTYLIYYWLSVRKTILLFYVMTVTYVCLIDTFTIYEGDKAIVRVVIFGFLLMGLLALERLVQRENLLGSKMSRHRWIVPLTVMLGVSSVVAFAAPKANPIWPDPVPYIQSFAEGAGGSGVNKIGYDTDDSQLGGPFVGDPTVVFNAEVTREHYWKIETKDLYTGKGWEQSIPDNQEEAISFESEEMVPFTTNEPDGEREVETERVTVERTYSHVVYPYGVERIVGNEEGYFSFDPVNEKVTSYEGEGETIQLGEYELSYRSPSYSQKKMKAANESQEIMQNPEFVDRYTQLPETTPQRVKDLALEITSEEDNWYDKVRAIENYFSKEAYVYDQFDVPVPEEGQDYVDQFLFETQRGYCDNFSTSMVVLVRALGIPARWAKGYTEGEYSRQVDTTYKQYEVSNNNAHSWVEVFFPEVGWVPFEPTVGFSNNVSYQYDLDVPESDNNEVPVPEKEEAPKQPIQPEEDDSRAAGSSFSLSKLWDDIQTFFVENWGKLVMGFILLLILAIALYLVRRRWMPYVLIFYYRRKSSDGVFSDAYLSLIKQLERYGLKMDDGQTLRGYSRYIDSFFGTHEMTSLTNNYERILYGQRLAEEDWPKMRELWENLIKRTTG
ncbi:transglutaminase TgpA family protein [Rossellomorea aquimaris]|uniref:transglutaminase TgpA family protein n=1 Tax=Rossellomorea aquimaris TaxID=189382 RepID=UPI0005C8E2B3|nr:transglutaminase domain-containing protein [Rossellomorea aquimaris]